MIQEDSPQVTVDTVEDRQSMEESDVEDRDIAIVHQGVFRRHANTAGLERDGEAGDFMPEAHVAFDVEYRL